MATMTLLQISNTLGAYVEPGGDFMASLNQVLSRLYGMGTYRDLTVQYSLPVVDGAVTLPDDAAAVLHTMVDGYPSPVRSLWHDFKSVGTNSPDTGPTWGLIDSGFWPTTRLIPESATVDTLFIVPSLSGVSAVDINLADEIVTVNANNGTRNYQGTSVAVDEKITFPVAITSITSISFDALLRPYDIRYSAADASTCIATVGPGSGVTRYRRFRVNKAVDGTTIVHVLCKRAFIPLQNDGDIVYIANLGVLKHGLLARIAEDNADLERAQFHWGQCFNLLEEEAASSRGAALPRPGVDPYGTGNVDKLRQMY
jgi:hypothetical protein